MPIIRVDDKGNNINKKKLRIAAGSIVAGMACASYVFINHDPLAGIFFGLWPIALSGVLNLLD